MPQQPGHRQAWRAVSPEPLAFCSGEAAHRLALPALQAVQGARRAFRHPSPRLLLRRAHRRSAPLPGGRRRCLPLAVASPMAPMTGMVPPRVPNQHVFPSGQPDSWAHGQPLCGRPEPMGATIDPETVRGMYTHMFAGLAAGIVHCRLLSSTPGPENIASSSGRV